MTTEVRSLSSSFSMISFFRVRLNSLDRSGGGRGETQAEHVAVQRTHEPQTQDNATTARLFYPSYLMLAELGRTGLKIYA